MSEEITQKTEDLSLNSSSDKTVFDSKDEFTVKHPLNNRWTLWYTKPQINKNENWQDLLKPVISFSSVEEFWGIFNSIPPTNQLPLKSDYHLFKEGIRPEWEDSNNSSGGKLQTQFSKKDTGIINDLWLRGLLAVIGETIEEDEDEVNGIVINIRKQAYRIGVWTKDCDESKLRSVGERLKKILQLKDDQKIEFTSHAASNTRGAEPQFVL
ncbi:TIF45 [Candida pseudojiufengensis]|uniref:TIF45 n=1 Tax=Candida pseudojiufengensis TaxID=497109 RepID=UPI002225618E|nr:TIF45 [Candida pseudojiufengensis]KAI5961845.1 TIF45 [Candida pseudojiufengensis]